MFDTRIGVRKVEGGYIVAIFGGRSDVAMREEIALSKADALAKATELHDKALVETERFLAQMEERRAADQQATGFGQFGGVEQPSALSGPLMNQSQRDR